MANHSLGSRFDVSTVAFEWCRYHAELIDVGRFEHVERLEGEDVDHEQVDADELAHLLVVTGVETRRLQFLVQAVTSFEVHTEFSARWRVGHPDGNAASSRSATLDKEAAEGSRGTTTPRRGSVAAREQRSRSCPTSAEVATGS